MIKFAGILEKFSHLSYNTINISIFLVGIRDSVKYYHLLNNIFGKEVNSLKKKEIAEAAGVSLATVSRVINNSGYVKKDKRDLVLKVMRDLNYPFNVQTPKKAEKSNRIGYVIPDITNPFFSEVLKGMYSVTEKEKLNIFIFDTNEDISKEIDALEMLKEQNVKGLIIAPTTDQNEYFRQYLEQIESLGVPIVLLDRDIKYSHYDAVYVDNIQGSFDAVQALISEGHQKIAILLATVSSRPGRDRFAGYKKAMLMNGIPVDEKYIFKGVPKIECGYDLAKKVITMDDPPTAIFSFNNVMTMGCIKAFREMNIKIPDDMAFIGFDDIDFINIMNLGMSVIDRPTYQMGEIAMKMLVERINEEKDPDIPKAPVKEVILPTKLILRGSEKYITK